LDATALLGFRQKVTAHAEKKHGVRITITDVLLWALSVSLRDCPQANRVWDNGQVVSLPTVDVGLAVTYAGGLTKIRIREVDRMGLLALARRRTELVDAVRSSQLPSDASGGGAIILYNAGKGCVDEYSSSVPVGQCCVLAVGCIKPRPFVADGKLEVRPTLRACLSVDARVLDGVAAAQLLSKFVELVEEPEVMVFRTL
jgi:pyruvate/2-oxoglutarate dehydrogenase complex dihydrolipoamide acyltransferase (E2) component